MFFFGRRTNDANAPINVTENIENIQFRMKQKYVIPLDVQVAHYTPAIFPLVPIISPKINQLCCDSWKKIVANKEMTESGLELNGITLFYNDFYERLGVMDENKKIEAVLGSHTTGQNKIAEKGAIIIRIVNYVLSLSNNDEQTQFRLYTLGKAHAKRKIRPYMYSIFVQVMLYTISAQLGTHASHEVMEAWVNMFAFIMKSMLPLAIKGQTVETEIAINTKCEFNSDNMKAQVMEAKVQSRNNSVRSARSNQSSYRQAGSHNTSNRISVPQGSLPHSPATSFRLGAGQPGRTYAQKPSMVAIQSAGDISAIQSAGDISGMDDGPKKKDISAQP